MWLVLSALISLGPAVVAYFQGHPLVAALLLAPVLISLVAAGFSSWLVRRCLPVSETVPSVTLIAQLSQMLGDPERLTVGLLDTEAPVVVLLGSRSRPALFVSRPLLERLDHEERRALFARLASGLGAREPAWRSRAVVFSGGPALVGRALVPALGPAWSLLATLTLPWAAAWQRGLLGWRRLTRADDRAALNGVDASALVSALEVLRDESGEVAGIDCVLAGLPVVPVRTIPDRQRFFGRLTTDLRASRLQAHAGYRRHERQTDTLVSLRPDDSPEWEVVDTIEGAIDLTRPGWADAHDPQPEPDNDFSHLEAIAEAKRAAADDPPSTVPGPEVSAAPEPAGPPAEDLASPVPDGGIPLEDLFAPVAGVPVADDPFAPAIEVPANPLDGPFAPVAQEGAADQAGLPNDPFAPADLRVATPAAENATPSTTARRRLWLWWRKRPATDTVVAAPISAAAIEDLAAADMISEGGPVAAPREDPPRVIAPEVAPPSAIPDADVPSVVEEPPILEEPSREVGTAPVGQPEDSTGHDPTEPQQAPPIVVPDDAPRRARRLRRPGRFRLGRRSRGRRRVPEPDVPYALDVELLPTLEPLFGPDPAPAPAECPPDPVTIDPAPDAGDTPASVDLADTQIVPAPFEAADDVAEILPEVDAQDSAPADSPDPGVPLDPEANLVAEERPDDAPDPALAALMLPMGPRSD